MITGAMIVSKYAKSDSNRKVDIICKYYPCFLAIVKNYISEMQKEIINEQDYNRRAELGDVGVKVQTSSIGDPTQGEAIRKTLLEAAILSGNFDGGELDDIDNKEEYIYKSSTVRKMLSDYEEFQNKLNELMPKERALFVSYLEQEISLDEIAESFAILYESAKQKIRRIKVSIKKNMSIEV